MSSIYSIHAVSVRLLFLAVMLFFSQLSLADGDIIRIDTPAKNAQLTSLPVEVSIRFIEPINPARFRAELNDIDVSNRFLVTETTATARLGVNDGIQITQTASRDDDDDKNLYRRDNDDSRQLIGFVENELEVKVVTVGGKRAEEEREFFVDQNATAVSVTIQSPPDNTQADNRLIQIEGVINGFDPAFTVTANSFPVDVDTQGNFSGAYALLEGANNIAVTVRDGQTVIASESITVTYIMPSEAALDIDPQLGGTVVVSNPDSPLFGAQMDIPAGAARRSFRASITFEPEQVPNLPFGNTPVGPPVVFNPIGEIFNAPITLTLPVDISLLGAASVNDVVVIADGEEGMVELPIISRTANTVSLQISEIFFSPFIVALPIPVQPGQLRIESNPAFATIYIDGADSGLRTPATLSNISAGRHDIKLYLAGFNEFFATQQVDANGSTFSTTLTPRAQPAPEIILDTPIIDGLVVTEAVLPLTGTVFDQGQVLPNATIVLSLNGLDVLETTNAQGRFNTAVVLLHGANVLELRANGSNGNTGILGPVTVNLGSPDITIRLNWNTNTTDLDLHVFDPSGNHAFFGNLTAIPGGSIDRDDVDGFGPEVFTLTAPPAGTYRVAVDAFRLTNRDTGDLIPTTGQLSVVLGSTTIFTGSFFFSAEDFNATNGTGGSTAAFWDAFTFEVGDLIIDNVSTQTPSNAMNAIFTTAPGENQITVDIQAPSIVPDADITIGVTETVENFVVNTAGLSGRQIVFNAAHAPLQGLVNPRNSHPLEYEIIARAPTAIDSAPATLTQDTRSQIRQEYVDKRDFNPTFIRVTPPRTQIIDSGQFPGSRFFTFNEFSRYSDFGPGLAVIDQSVAIADQLRDAWGNPLRVTSGYRNPRNNDSLANSVINSFHQTGNAIDLNPSRNPSNWPLTLLCDPANPATRIVIADYADAQQALTCLAERLFPGPAFDAFFHLNHIHIEMN